MIKLIIDVQDSKVVQRARYVFSQIAFVDGLQFEYSSRQEGFQQEDIIIYYGEKTDSIPSVSNKTICIPCFKSIEKLIHKRGKEIPAVSGVVNYKNIRIPFWYYYYELANINSSLEYESGGCAVGKKNNVTYLGFDLIMSIFHLLSCQEEYLIAKRDKFNRFLGEYSPRYPGFLEEPIVNYYLLILENVIFNRSAPSSPSCRVVLSHDVDIISHKEVFVLLGNLLRILLGTLKLDLKGTVQKVKHLWRKLLSGQNSYYNFEKYVEIERQFHALSAFYFIGGQKGFYGARYDWTGLRDTMRNLVNKGWNIGLHTNFYDYDNESNITQTKQTLENLSGSSIYGARNHYLRFSVPESWEALYRAGMQYDTTLGYPDQIGFRAGIAAPFYPYNLLEERVINIIEIPLIIMDGTLFNYMKLSKQEAVQKAINLIKKVARVNGLVTIQWHNRVLNNIDFPGWGEAYTEILRYICRKKAHVITEKDVVERMEQSK